MEGRVDDESRESQKDISTKFLDMILEDIKEIEEFEICMGQGCENLLEFIQTFTRDPSIMNYVRVKNMGFLIQRFVLLLPKIKDIVEKEKIESIEKKLKKIKVEFEEGIYLEKVQKRIFVFHEPRDGKNKTRRVIIDSLFYILADKLTNLRADILSGLKHILHSQKGGKQSGKQIE